MNTKITRNSRRRFGVNENDDIAPNNEGNVEVNFEPSTTFPSTLTLLTLLAEFESKYGVGRREKKNYFIHFRTFLF